MDLKQLAAQYGGQPVSSRDPLESLASQFGGTPVKKKPEEESADLAAKFGGKPVDQEEVAAPVPAQAAPTKELQDIGFETDPDQIVLKRLMQGVSSSDPKVLEKAYQTATTSLARAKQEAQRAVNTGASEDQARQIFAQNLAPADTLKAAPEIYDYYQAYRVRPSTTGIEDTASAAKRGLTSGYLGLAQSGGGQLQFIQDMLGIQSESTEGALKSINERMQAIGEAPTKPQQFVEGAISSITQQLPALGVGAVTGSTAVVLGDMFKNTFGQTYNDSRTRDMDLGESTARATAYATFEVLGERYGLGDLIKGIKAAADGVPTSKLSQFFTDALLKEIPGEQLTYAGQFATDKLFKVNPEAGVKNYIEGAMDTLGATLVQGGMMMGGANVAGAAARSLARSREEAPEVSMPEIQRETAQGEPVVAKEEVIVPQVSELEQTSKKYEDMGHTKENALLLATQELKETAREQEQKTSADVGTEGGRGEVVEPGVGAGVGVYPERLGAEVQEAEEPATGGLGGVNGPVGERTAGPGRGEETESSALAAQFGGVPVEAAPVEAAPLVHEPSSIKFQGGKQFTQEDLVADKIENPRFELLGKRLDDIKRILDESLPLMDKISRMVRPRRVDTNRIKALADELDNVHYYARSAAGDTYSTPRTKLGEMLDEVKYVPTKERLENLLAYVEELKTKEQQGVAEPAEAAPEELTLPEEAPVEEASVEETPVEEAVAAEVAPEEEPLPEEVEPPAPHVVEANKLAAELRAIDPNHPLIPTLRDELALTPEEVTAAREEVDKLKDEVKLKRALDTVGTAVRQKATSSQNIVPEEQVSMDEVLSALADIMQVLVKRGVKTIAEATKQAREMLGANANKVTPQQYKDAFKIARDRERQEVKAAKEENKYKTQANKTLAKLEAADTPETFGEVIGELIKNRDWEDVKDFFKALASAASDDVLEKLLIVLPTTAIEDLAGTDIPQLRRIGMVMKRIAGMRTKMLSAASDIVDPWLEYNAKVKGGKKQLARVMNFATLEGIDFSKYSTVEDAIEDDAQIEELKAKKAVATKPGSAVTYDKLINERIQVLRAGFKEWTKLNNMGVGTMQGAGENIYKRVLNFFKSNFDLYRAILDQRIEALDLEGTIDDASTPKGKLMASIRRIYEASKEVRVYFPLNRFGTHWVRIGKGESQVFIMNGNRYVRDANARFSAATRNLMKETGLSFDELVEDGQIERGDDVKQLLNQAAENSALLKSVFELIDSQEGVEKEEQDEEAAEDMLTNKDALKDAIYELYLMTMPEQSFRKQFMHRKGVAGFSNDALRGFVKNAYAIAAQVSKLKFSPDVYNNLDAATQMVRHTPDETRSKLYIKEIRTRAQDELSPGDESNFLSRLSNGLSALTFQMMLTAPRNALINMLAIPTFLAPKLYADYGAGAAAKKLAEYTKVWEKFGTTTVNSETGAISFSSPSVGISTYVQSNPLLRAAFEEAMDLNTTEVTRTYDLADLGRKPTKRSTLPVLSQLGGGFRFLGKMQSAAFQTSERIIREIAFMATFELEYAKALKEGLKGGVHGPAFTRAVEVADRTTDETMFNYMRYNRPRLFKKPLARIPFQFQMYNLQAYTYLIKNQYKTIKYAIRAAKNISDPVERTAALLELRKAFIMFVGTAMMTAVNAGLSGLPFASLMIYVLYKLLHDDDEEDAIPFEERDMMHWFQTWLNENLGDTVGRMAEKGVLSELTGWDFASSTSLNTLWFRDIRDTDSLSAQFGDAMVSALGGPAISMLKNFLGAYENIQDGYYVQGTKKLLPAFERGAYEAYVWSRLGVLSKELNEIIARDELTGGQLIGKTLGFNPIKLTRMQEANFSYEKQVAKAQQERNKIIKRIELEFQRSQVDDMHVDKLNDWMDKAAEFTEKNPPEFAIKGDTILNSIQNKQRIRALADRGLEIPESFAPLAYSYVEVSRQ